MTRNNQDYIEPFDTYINSKVIFTDPTTEEDTVIKLFDMYQIKWFNQQNADDLYDYFQEVIAFYKAEEEFLCTASSVLDLQNGKLSTGYNYGIIQRDDYSMRNDEDDEDENNMWITQGWKNNYGVAVSRELERVCSEHEKIYELQNRITRLEKDIERKVA